MLIDYSLTVDQFFKPGTFVNIARQAVFVGILSVGLAMVVTAGHMNQSTESVMAFSAMMAACLIGTNGFV